MRPSEPGAAVARRARPLKGLAFLLGALLLAALPGVSLAVFEDLPAGARQLGLGGQSAALEDALSFYANPALPGSRRKFETGGQFLSSDRSTQGPESVKAYGAWAVVPRMAYGRLGTLTLGWLYDEYGGSLKQKTLSLGWGTWNLIRGDSGILDFGANFKVLNASDGQDSASGAALDLGAVFRPDGSHTLGFSILNVNNPAFNVGSRKDHAPRVARLAVSERREDYTISLDLAARSASDGYDGNVSFDPGVEHVWRTERSGAFYSRAGLNLAERASALSAGLGWKHGPSELSYGVAVPLTAPISAAHSLTLSLRFGDRDLEDDYERLIKREIKYRKDLVEALDESTKREGMLRDELASMKTEIDSLSAQLRGEQAQKASVTSEKERLAAIVRKQQTAEAEFQALAAKRRADKLNQLRYGFSLDWEAYLKLKGGGAPSDVLKGSLQRMISQYQDSGIDISRATVELQGLLSGK